MQRLLLTILMIMTSIIANGYDGGYYPQSLNGLSGKELLEALRVAIRSRQPVMSQYDESLLWDYFTVLDNRSDGTVWDIFSTDVVTFDNHNGVTASHIAHPLWAGDLFPYDSDLAVDLHNIFPCNQAAALQRGSLVPWEVEDIEWENGSCSVGTASLLGVEIRAYEPSDCYKGDIARVLMYVAACYGGEFAWQDQSWNLFNDGPYPVFHEFSIEIMLAWCALDPVDEKEINRNEAIYQLQGNRNPFVDFPLIERYIWGDLKDTPYEYEPSSGNDPQEETGYLQATYHTGDKIWLRSRYVPDDATWSIGGNVVNGAYIMASELGTGLHELQFTSPSAKGKITIEIKP